MLEKIINQFRRNQVPYIFHSKNWSKASFKQKMQALQSLEKYNAQIMGREVREIRPVAMSKNTLGNYDDHDRCLYINQDLVNQKGSFENSDTGWYCARNVTHEGTHATQYDILNGRNVNLEEIKEIDKDLADKELLKKDYDTYTNDEGPDYHFSTFEYTARKVGNIRITELYNQAHKIFGEDNSFSAIMQSNICNNIKQLDAANKICKTKLTHDQMYNHMKELKSHDISAINLKQSTYSTQDSATQSDKQENNQQKANHDSAKNELANIIGDSVAQVEFQENKQQHQNKDSIANEQDATATQDNASQADGHENKLQEANQDLTVNEQDAAATQDDASQTDGQENKLQEANQDSTINEQDAAATKDNAPQTEGQENKLQEANQDSTVNEQSTVTQDNASQTHGQENKLQEANQDSTVNEQATATQDYTAQVEGQENKQQEENIYSSVNEQGANDTQDSAAQAEGHENKHQEENIDSSVNEHANATQDNDSQQADQDSNVSSDQDYNCDY